MDYRRTIYWNPDVETNERGVANIKFYNNSYSRSLNVSVEGMANGEFIVYDSQNMNYR